MGGQPGGQGGDPKVEVDVPTGWQAGFDGLQKGRLDVGQVGQGGATGVQHELEAGASDNRRRVTADTIDKITKHDPRWPGPAIRHPHLVGQRGQESGEKGPVLGRESRSGVGAELAFKDDDLVTQDEIATSLSRSPMGSNRSAAKAFVTVR
ncbi:hypothetical protein [Nonomuraea sp. NPDC002799]